MLDLILLSIFSYALYRLTVGHNITPWKWVIRYVAVMVASYFTFFAILVQIYGQSMIKDTAFALRISLMVEPFILLYQFVLFFFFRLRILKYVHALDQLEKIDNTPPPSSPQTPKKEDKDLSYFR